MAAGKLRRLVQFILNLQNNFLRVFQPFSSEALLLEGTRYFYCRNKLRKFSGTLEKVTCPVYTRQHWSSHFLQGTKKTRRYLTCNIPVSGKVWIGFDSGYHRVSIRQHNNYHPEILNGLLSVCLNFLILYLSIHRCFSWHNAVRPLTLSLAGQTNNKPINQ